jgi:hypothetical protein
MRSVLLVGARLPETTRTHPIVDERGSVRRWWHQCDLRVVLDTRAEAAMQRIGFVLSPGFQVMSFAVLSVFELENEETGEPIYDVRVLSKTGASRAARSASAS